MDQERLRVGGIPIRYSLGLKRAVIIDVIAVALGFLLNREHRFACYGSEIP